MTISAGVKFVQGATVGVAGRALFGVTGTAVTTSNGNDAGVVKWTFTIIDVPPLSTVPTGQVQSGASPTYMFTPDVTGGYAVRIDLVGGDGSVATDTRVFGIKRPSGRFIPPFLATNPQLNFSAQTRGWAPHMEEWLTYLDGLTSANSPVFFAALSTLTPTAGRQSQNIDGFSSVRDGGEGRFDWNSASTATPDGGTIVQVTGIGTGRWVRSLPHGHIDVRYFGAPQTGSGFADTQFANAVATAAALGLDLFAPGDYSFNAQALALGSLKCLRGTSWLLGANYWYADPAWTSGIGGGFSGSVLRGTNPAFNVIQQTPASSICTVKDIAIVGAGSGITQIGISSGVVNGRLHLRNVAVGNCYVGIDPGFDEGVTQERLQVTGNVYGVRIISGPTTCNWRDVNFSSNAYSLYVGSCQIINFSGGTFEASSCSMYFVNGVRDFHVRGFYEELTGSVNRLANAIHTTFIPIGFTTSPTTNNGHWYICTVAGMTTGVEPTWMTGVGSTTVWGTAQFKEGGPGGGTGGGSINVNIGNAAITFDTTAGTISSVHFGESQASEASLIYTIGSNGVNGFTGTKLNCGQIIIPANWFGTSLLACPDITTNNAVTTSIIAGGQLNGPSNNAPFHNIPSPFVFGGVKQYSGQDGVNNLTGNYPFAGQLQANPVGTTVALGSEAFNPTAGIGQVARWKATTSGLTGYPYSVYALTAPAVNSLCLASKTGRVVQVTTPVGTAPAVEPNWTVGLGLTTTDSGGNVWTDVGAGVVWTPLYYVGGGYGGYLSGQGGVTLVNGANHNVAIGTASYATVTGTAPTAAVTIGGFTPSQPPTGGTRFTLRFNVNQNVTFTYNSGSDTYPLLNKSGADLTVATTGASTNYSSTDWVFDSLVNAWILD